MPPRFHLGAQLFTQLANRVRCLLPHAEEADNNCAEQPNREGSDNHGGDEPPAPPKACVCINSSAEVGLGWKRLKVLVVPTGFQREEVDIRAILD